MEFYLVKKKLRQFSLFSLSITTLNIQNWIRLDNDMDCVDVDTRFDGMLMAKESSSVDLLMSHNCTMVNIGRFEGQSCQSHKLL